MYTGRMCQTTLVFAALQHGQSVDSVRLLVRLGASVTEVDREGNTALHWALLGTQDTAGGIFSETKWLLSVSVCFCAKLKVCYMMGKYPPRSVDAGTRRQASMVAALVTGVTRAGIQLLPWAQPNTAAVTPLQLLREPRLRRRLPPTVQFAARRQNLLRGTTGGCIR